MNMNRRKFHATCAAGAAALTLGVIPKAKAREKARGLEVGDEVILVKSACHVCPPTKFVGRWGIVLWDDPQFGYRIALGNYDWTDVCKDGLVRVLPGPLEVGDRVASVDKRPNMIFMFGKLGTVTSPIEVRYDDGSRIGFRYSYPMSYYGFTKIEELS